jgi:hypothetical protein
MPGDKDGRPQVWYNPEAETKAVSRYYGTKITD